MLNSRNYLRRRYKYLLGSLIPVLIAVTCVAFIMGGNDDFNLDRREVLLRSIGHELLLESGDSTSRVLPIKTIGENEYQIRFENKLTFRSAYLVNTTRRLLAKDPLTGDYVVKVLNSGNSSVVYGYAISKNKKDDIVTCVGRRLPSAHYMVNIKFKPTDKNKLKSEFLLGGLPFLTFVGFILLRSVKQREVLPGAQHTATLALGSALFDAGNRKLMINGRTIDLTGTETRLLLIFALSPNEMIERSRLQKEIWEDEGIIVGRSLDMFISKLRKKLEPVSGISIVVVRGKGYILEINS